MGGESYRQEKMNDKALEELRMHEKVCSIRYEHIEKSLNEGREKFIRMDQKITGLYVIIITGGLSVLGVVSTIAYQLA